VSCNQDIINLHTHTHTYMQWRGESRRQHSLSLFWICG
jgi:hypothetical protein